MRFYLLLTALVSLSIALPRHAQAQGDFPPPPPKPTNTAPSDGDSREHFTIVEEMPRFPGCEHDSIPHAERDYCAQGKLIEYVSQNIKYPADAREKGIHGVVVISFIVDKKGNVSDIELLRNPGAELGEEGLRIVRKMAEEKTWIPGRQKNKPVAVKFTLPIRFSLNNSDEQLGGTFDPSKAGSVPPPPPPPPAPEEDSSNINISGLSRVDPMPRFLGCEEEDISDEAKKQCALKKLTDYIADNISYPDSARANNVEGVALVSFVVSQEGKIEEIRLLRDPGAGLGEEALRIAHKMAEEKTWSPGYQKDNPVRVRMTLPVRFRLK